MRLHSADIDLNQVCWVLAQYCKHLTLRPPELTSADLVGDPLNAMTPAGEAAGAEAGGIIFEDPAWAVFAAHAVSQIPRLGVPLAPTTIPCGWS